MSDTVSPGAGSAMPPPSSESSGGAPSSPTPDAQGADGTVADVDKQIRTRSASAVGDGVAPEGFDTAVVRITAADGSVCEVCMWLADDAASRSQGLRGVTDLAGPVGMAFEFEAPTTGNFFMFETPTPLSIAWFAPDGSFLTTTDMSPCLDAESSRCERYGTTGAYTLAIEMFQGELDTIGIGPGSTAELLTVDDPTSPDHLACLDPA